MSDLLANPYFILITFTMVALTSLVLFVIRVVRYYMVQQEKRLFLFAASNVFEALAFGMGALLSAPRPTGNFLYLYTWARMAWGMFAVTYLVAVIIEQRALKRTIKGRA